MIRIVLKAKQVLKLEAIVRRSGDAKHRDRVRVVLMTHRS